MSARTGELAVGFDFGGTLAPRLSPLLYRFWRDEFTRQIGAAAARTAHVEFERAQTAYYDNPDSRSCPSLKLATDALQRTLRDADPVRSSAIAARVDAGVRERFAAEVPVQQGAPELLRWLADQEIDAGILSNFVFPTQMVEDWLATHGICGYVSVVMTSCDMGLSKPSADAFDALIRGLNLSRADQLIYVGNDWEEDVEGALAAGCRAIYVTGNDPGGQPDRRDIRVPEVSSLRQVPRVIQSMRAL